MILVTQLLLCKVFKKCTLNQPNLVYFYISSLSCWKRSWSMKSHQRLSRNNFFTIFIVTTNDDKKPHHFFHRLVHGCSASSVVIPDYYVSYFFPLRFWPVLGSYICFSPSFRAPNCWAHFTAAVSFSLPSLFLPASSLSLSLHQHSGSFCKISFPIFVAPSKWLSRRCLFVMPFWVRCSSIGDFLWRHGPYNAVRHTLEISIREKDRFRVLKVPSLCRIVRKSKDGS